MANTVKDHLRGALALMFKPLVRLLIAQGVTHAEFADTVKEVYVETAVRHFAESGKINKSRIAILTGLTRKEVKNVIDRALSSDYKERTYSRPGRVLTGWYSDPLFQGPYGIPLELPYESTEGDEMSFSELVRRYSGDMAPRQMLNQLMESGAVVDVEGRYKVVNRTYTHSLLSPSAIRRLGDVGYRVFSTAARNIDRKTDTARQFDRMIMADDGCTDELIEKFDEYIKFRGQAFLEELDVWFSSRRDLNKSGDERKETGLYMVHYVEDKHELGTLRTALNERGMIAVED